VREWRSYEGIVSWAVPLFRSTDPLRKNDVLASKLLFALLAIAVIEQLVVSSIVRTSHSPKPVGTEDVWISIAVWAPLVLGWLAIGGCYYAIRKGKPWAKLLVLTLFLWRVYSTTFLPGYIMAGIVLNRLPEGWQLVTLLKVALNIAALVLMFKKPRIVALIGTSYV
jgi:hypothetical protein